MAKAVRGTVTREVVTNVVEDVVNVQYSEAEARTLACFAYCQISGGSTLLLPVLQSLFPLYEKQTGLQSFTNEEQDAMREECKEWVGFASKRSELVVLERRTEELVAELGRVQEALRIAQIHAVEPDDSLPGRRAEGSWHATAEQEATPETRKWKVQYSGGSTIGPAIWKHVTPKGHFYAPHSFDSYVSRNEAYRQMRSHAKHSCNPLENYRVVPYDYPEGEDKRPRGKYIVEAWSNPRRTWVRSSLLFREYVSVIVAEEGIAIAGSKAATYRVRWVP